MKKIYIGIASGILVLATTFVFLLLPGMGGDEGFGNNDSNKFEISIGKSTQMLYAGSMLGEEPRPGSGGIQINDGGKLAEVFATEPNDTYTVEFDASNIDKNTAGVYEASYKIKKGDKVTPNAVPVEYTVYHPSTTNVRAAKASETEVNILYLHVNTADNVTHPPQNYIEEWKKQMTEFYNYGYAPLRFNLTLVYETLNQTSSQIMEEWHKLPTYNKTTGIESYGVDYYIIAKAMKNNYGSIEWNKFDAISSSISRGSVPKSEIDSKYPGFDTDHPLGLAAHDVETIPEIALLNPNIGSAVKKNNETIHKGTVGIGYNRTREYFVGEQGYTAHFYKEKWGLAHPNPQGGSTPVHQNIFDSEIGSKNLNGWFDFSRMSAANFPTVKSNLIGGNQVYNGINTLMHETIHALSVEHSKATVAEGFNIYPKFIEKPWDQQIYAISNEQTDASCRQPGAQLGYDCNMVFSDYLDPFDNMSHAELAQRFTTNSRGVLLGSAYDRIIPAPTATSVTVKPGAAEFKDIYLPVANEAIRAPGAPANKYKNFMHVLTLEFLGNDETTSHFNDYGVLKANLDGILIRYTMINLSTFARETVLLDGDYTPGDINTFMTNDDMYAFKPGKSITIQGVKVDVVSINQTTGAVVNVTSV